MSENPLLPHRKLKELHALMLRCRDLERVRRPRPVAAREAVLAAAAIHLLPKDILFAAAGDDVPQQLKPSAKGKSASLFVAPDASLPTFALAAATAHGLRAAGTDSLVVEFTQENASEPGWAAALEWAQRNNLPLIVVCTASYPSTKPTKSRLNSEALAWEAVSRKCALMHVPVVSVDGEDAVALYRVFQETTLHARTGGGPAIIWAMLQPAPLPRSHTPLARLEAYLRARNIKLSR